MSEVVLEEICHLEEAVLDAFFLDLYHRHPKAAIKILLENENHKIFVSDSGLRILLPNILKHETSGFGGEVYVWASQGNAPF